MENGQTVLLPCHVTRSGFSGERVFRLTLADQSEYVGVAPIDYCRRQDRSPLGPDEPAKGHSIEGFVGGHVLANGGRLAHLVVPDGEVIQFPIQQIRFIKLREDDVIAQLTVATISSTPQQTHAEAGSSTNEQAHVSGQT